MLQIAPSVLAIEPQTLDGVLDGILKVPSADYLHIDVMDGKFVPQTTMFLDPSVTSAMFIRCLSNADFFFDVHLMVEHPEQYVADFADARADLITFHYEAADNVSDLIQLIKQSRVRVGIALNPDTDVSVVEPFLQDIDLVLLMSVHPGKCGQQYIADVTPKITALKRLIVENNYDVVVQVDGGIKEDNAYIPTNAGADILVSGSGVFSNPDPDAAVRRMKDVIIIGSDHGGYVLRQKIMKHLDEQHHAYYDIGVFSPDSCDYPVYAKSLAQPISDGAYSRGILVCGTGIGMSIQANRYPGVRAAVVYDEFTAKMAREHNDANVLCLGERSCSSMGKEELLRCVDIFLTTPFSGEERHVRRLEQIDKE